MKTSPSETERTQTYLNSAFTCLCILSTPFCLLLATDLICLLSLSAIKPSNLAVPPMATPLPREGAGLMMDLLQYVSWWPAHRTLGLLPCDPSVFPEPVQSLTCVFRLYPGKPKKMTHWVAYLTGASVHYWLTAAWKKSQQLALINAWCMQWNHTVYCNEIKIVKALFPFGSRHREPVNIYN